VHYVQSQLKKKINLILPFVFIVYTRKNQKTTKYEPTYGHVTSCSNCEEAQAPIYRVCSAKCYKKWFILTPDTKYEFLNKPPEWWIEKKERDEKKSKGEFCWTRFPKSLHYTNDDFD
jgi:hypothetical protein